MNFADSDIVPPASTWVFPTLGIMHYNKQVGERGRSPRRVGGGSLAMMVGAGVPPSPSLVSHRGRCRLFGEPPLFAEANSSS